MIKIINGDITKVPADVIVNAANSTLLGGGGVDGAIHRAGGPSILEDCKRIIDRQGGCETGEAVITTAGDLPARYVIHTVGPVWRGGGEREADLLSNCYRNSLELSLQNKCKSVAFPNISTGIYGYPKGEAAKIAVGTISEFLATRKGIEEVFLVCFDEENQYLVEEQLLKLE